MNYKKLPIILLAIFLSVIAVYAITLTKEATEKVVVPFAIKGDVCLWDSATNQCLEPNENIIFGRAEAYPIIYTTVVREGEAPVRVRGESTRPHSMILIIFKDKLYRSTTISYEYYETNCRETERSERVCERWKGEEDKVVIEGEERICEEWGILNYMQKVCDIVGIKQQSGELSTVTETGYETEDRSSPDTYNILYDEEGSKKIEYDDGTEEYYNNNVKDLELNLGNNIYKLQNIDKVLEEEIVWIPK